MGIARVVKKKPILRRHEEAAAGLEARCQLVMKYYGGRAKFAKHFRLSYPRVKSMRRFPHTIATMVHNDRSLNIRLRASFCRPDLKFNPDGTLKGSPTQGARKKVYS